MEHVDSSPCTIAIDTAQEEISNATILCQKNDLPKEEMNNDNTTTTTTTTISDPNDLAAAFFAAEARKKKEVTKLPIEDWSTRFPKLRLRCISKEEEEESNHNNNDDCTTKEFMDQAARFRIQLKEKLVQAFMNELLNEAEIKMKL